MKRKRTDGTDIEAIDGTDLEATTDGTNRTDLEASRKLQEKISRVDELQEDMLKDLPQIVQLQESENGVSQVDQQASELKSVPRKHKLLYNILEAIFFWAAMVVSCDDVLQKMATIGPEKPEVTVIGEVPYATFEDLQIILGRIPTGTRERKHRILAAPFTRCSFATFLPVSGSQGSNVDGQVNVWQRKSNSLRRDGFLQRGMILIYVIFYIYGKRSEWSGSKSNVSNHFQTDRYKI